MCNDCEKRQIKQYLSCKRLSLDEEHCLIDRAVNHNDKVAQDELVKSHLYLVASTALKQDFNHLSVVDLMQEGVLGLWDALRTFKISSGNRFSTLAGHHVLWRIRKAIKREKYYKPPGTSSLDAPLSSDSDGNDQLKDLIKDTHHISAEFELFMQETEKSINCDLITLGEFLEGALSAPFDRRNIGNGIIKSSYDIGVHTEIQECGISLFSTLDPFERCTLFKRLLSL